MRLPDICRAAGLLALLDEPEQAVQAQALDSINKLVHSFWPEVADEVVKMCVVVLGPRRSCRHSRFRHYSESLSERTDFPAHQLASLVAAKVYYHLGSLDEALTFALGAGKLFDVGIGPGESDSEFVETIIGAFLTVPS